MKTNELLRVNLTPHGVIRWGFTVLCTLLLFAQLSFAQDISARFLADYGNVTVVEATGNFDEKTPEGVPNTAPRQAVAKEFFHTHKDEYDFVTIITNFDFTMSSDAVAFYSHVKNDVSGIGQKIYDNSKDYGSNGKLQGTIDMGNLLKLATNPLDPKFNFTVDTMMHETLHRWSAYVKFKDWNGTVSDALLGQDKAHWSFLLDSAGSTLYGNKWKDNGNGTFTSTAVRKYYSPLDLYVMGMIDKSKVPPTLLIDNPAIDPTKMPEIGDTINGTARYVNVDDIIAVQDQGERVPNAKDSQKQFKVAFIYVVSPGTFKFDDLPGIENVRNAYLTRFSILTDGKGLVQVTSTPKDNLATNPGVIPPSTTPRTLPSDINSGVTWLMNHQQTDGSWTDFVLTTERDTAETATTLQRFPVATQSSQAGFAWLGSNSSANTDYLARRIEAAVQAHSDSSALVQELLAQRNRDGGWGSNRNFVSSATDTALALKALAVASYSDSSVTGPAIAYLQATQNSDNGGWSGDDAFSTIQPTAAVLTAFNHYRKNYTLESNITQAVAFLASKQNKIQNGDGGFGNSPSTVYDTALAVIALQAVGADKTMSGNGVTYLQGQQSENGAWFDSPYQTALAVRAVWSATVDPDLSIKPEDIAIIPATITTVPTNAVLSASISNLGSTDVTQATVAVYDGVVAKENQVAVQTAAFPGLSPAGPSPVTLTFSIPVTDSKGHVFHVVIDPDNLLRAESNKNNNRALKQLLPELTYDFQVLASDITVTPNPVDIGKDVKIAFKVSNSGTSDASKVPVKIFIDQPGAPLEIATLTVDITAGGSAIKETTWKASLAGVNLPLTVQVIDPNNIFSDKNKDNNSASIPLTVIASTLPNLSVSYRDMVITPSPAREGGNASISVLVKNDGYSAVDNVKVDVYNGNAFNGGIPLGSQVIPALGVGQSATATIVWTGIAVNGVQMITVQVNPLDNSTQEITKDDNFTFLNLDVLSLPDLAISTSLIVINPATPNSKTVPINIAVTVQNGGEQEAKNVIVQVKENGTIIDSTVIPLVNGNSQATAILGYNNVGQAGTHQITVTVAPDSVPGNLIVEKTKDNNTAIKIFSIQDADLWLTEPYISPNGDDIKDSTDFSFRLAATAKVSVQVINKKGVAVRTFSGGELDNTAGATVTWDGRSDAGVIVADGDYQIRVVSQSNVLLATLPVVVDNNQSFLADAIGTRYLLQNNMTCQVPTDFSEWNWLPHDSGVWFRNAYTMQNFPSGLYQMSPSGEDIRKITPEDWSDSSYDYFVETETATLNSDGTKVAVAVWKYERNTSRYIGGIWEQAVDGSGRRELVGDMELNIGKLKWSPDSKQIVFSYGPQDYWGYTAYEIRMVHSESGGMTIVDGGSPYWYSENAFWSPDSRFLAYSINTHCNADKSNCNQGYETLMVADVNGATSVVHTSTNNIYSYSNLHWLADGMILVEESPGYREDRLLLLDSLNQTPPRVVQKESEYPVYSPVFDIHPDLRSIALVSQHRSSTEPSRSLDVVGLDGSVIAVGDMGSYADGPTDNPAAPVWSQAGDKLAYVERELRTAENMVYENLVIYDRASNDSKKFTITVSNPPTFNNYSGNGASFKVNRLIAWLSAK
jgi:Squalene-hopene cyclase C-terminal domain/CARDB/FlgD Ig-like domain/Prenyltransferase and squalene oxidase repeat